MTSNDSSIQQLSGSTGAQVGTGRPHPSSRGSRIILCASIALGFTASLSFAAQSGQIQRATWPQAYSVQRNETTGLLTLSTPYYTVQHDPKQGGAITSIRLTYGKATNLLVRPIATRVRDQSGALLTDLADANPRFSHRRDGLAEVVTVESRLLDEKGHPSAIQTRSVFEYHWGYVKIHREFIDPAGTTRVQELSPLMVVLAPNLSEYGYREGVTEQEGAPPFSFGSNRWGKLRAGNSSDPILNTRYVPRSMILVDPDVEGLEWFVGSDLSQWDLQLTGKRGQGQCLLEPSKSLPGLELTVSPFRGNTGVVLPKSCSFDFYIGVPILEGHAQRPWLHTSFNRNRGEWVSKAQIQHWADSGIQTVHCHNDGDYYDDGLFWRDGSYPPYPDMQKYNDVIDACHRAGIRVATYFSNKELHPSTTEFQEHGSEWSRQDSKGKIQHNFYRGKNEFGAQMCLRSGWLDFLKLSIDRVLKNHPLDGVYYDWNVALFCANGLHEGKKAGESASGHWDIDELLNLMEWTRRRVGPEGLVIVHNTTTPMFTMENFADYVVANEWGYGKWKDNGPELTDLPLEWSLAGARARGVISYGQIDSQSPRRLHRLFALDAFLGGVTPWPASREAFDLAALLKPLGDMQKYRFVDWRNEAVVLQGTRCASAVYSRPGEAYLLLANLTDAAQEVRCTLHPGKLPNPLNSVSSAALLDARPAGASQEQSYRIMNVDASRLTGEGVTIPLPANDSVLLRVH